MDPVAIGNQQAENLYQQNAPTLPGAGSMASLGSTTQQAQAALDANSGTAGAAPPSAPAAHGNLLERLLPTAGGILGAIAGAPLDPFTGGLASVGLAGALSGAGKAGENALTGQKVFQGNDLTSGLEGAAGQGLAKGAGALLGKSGSLLSGIAKDNAAKIADTATTRADTQAGIDTATAYKNNYGSIAPRLQADLKLGTNGKFVDDMGGTGSDPASMQDVSKGGLELNNVYNDALENAPDVNMQDFGNQIYKTMQENGTTDLSTTPLGKALQDYGLGPNETLPESMPATEVRKLQQSVGTQIGNTQKLINNAELQGTANTEAEGQLQTLNNVYKDLGTKLKTPEVNDAIANTNIDDTQRVALQGQYGDTHGNYIADTINNAKSADDLLKPMQSYNQMNSASNMALNDINNAPGTPRALARTKAEITGPAPAGNLLSADNVVGAGSLFEGLAKGHPLALAAPLALKAVENPAVQAGAGSILSKIGAGSLPAVAGQVIGNSPNDVAGPAGTGSAVSLNQNPSMNNQDSPLYQTLNQDLTMGKEAEIDPYLAGNYSTGISQLPSLIQAVQKVQQAQAAEQALTQNFNQAGGAQGPLGGILSRLGSTFTGGEAASYPAQAQAEAQAIAQATGMPAQEVAGALPGITQDQSAAQASLGNIQSLIQALTQPQGQQNGLVGAVQ